MPIAQCTNRQELTRRPLPNGYAVIALDSVESGTTEFRASFSEQVQVENYATEGVFENAVKLAESPETGWAARGKASGEELRISFVVHDDRGGVSWGARAVRGPRCHRARG